MLDYFLGILWISNSDWYKTISSIRCPLSTSIHPSVDSKMRSSLRPTTRPMQLALNFGPLRLGQRQLELPHFKLYHLWPSRKDIMHILLPVFYSIILLPYECCSPIHLVLIEASRTILPLENTSWYSYPRYQWSLWNTKRTTLLIQGVKHPLKSSCLAWPWKHCDLVFTSHVEKTSKYDPSSQILL
jgi:hypothetical protein